MCSYLEAIEMMMVGSGFEDIVILADVFAGCTINKVMAGNHYNRAMRDNQLMFDATGDYCWMYFLFTTIMISTLQMNCKLWQNILPAVN